MLYFIPAWYKKNEWCENEQIWYIRRMHTEFDDTVKQIQLFHRKGNYPYRIMILSFVPNFRHFLHRQGVYRAPYWSCFDAIQEIRRKKAIVLSFHNLNWPEGVEFAYGPYVIIAFLKGDKYAQIELGEDGNPIQIDLYNNGLIIRRNIYDDRGFVSSTIIYENEKVLYQDYLMENGIWKLRFFQTDGHVEVNPKYKEYRLLHQNEERIKKFSKLSYESMEQVICEVLTSYLDLTGDNDVFCVAMHVQHVRLLQGALRGRKMILSFFADRYSVADQPEASDMIKQADYIITDSGENVKKIQKESGMLIKNITAITPYDSRVDLGISQQLDTQKILVPVDNINSEDLGKIIRILGRYLLTNENVQIHLFTRKADFDRKRRILEMARKALKRGDLEEGWAMEGDGLSGDNLDIAEIVPVKFFVEQCVDELTVTQCMREQRVLVDLRTVPELYLQITAISMGIPQIVRTRTEFVYHGGNGIVLKKAVKLHEALDFYLKGLKNWNEAMVFSYDIGKEYTTEKLMEIWRGVIDSIG